MSFDLCLSNITDYLRDLSSEDILEDENHGPQTMVVVARNPKDKINHDAPQLDFVFMNKTRFAYYRNPIERAHRWFFPTIRGPDQIIIKTFEKNIKHNKLFADLYAGHVTAIEPQIVVAKAGTQSVPVFPLSSSSSTTTRTSRFSCVDVALCMDEQFPPNTMPLNTYQLGKQYRVAELLRRNPELRIVNTKNASGASTKCRAAHLALTAKSPALFLMIQEKLVDEQMLLI